MGMTIHWDLKSNPRSEAGALDIVQKLHAAAQDLPFKEIGAIIDLTGDDCDFEKCSRDDPNHWLLIQASGRLELTESGEPYDRHKHKHLASIHCRVAPTRVIAFPTWPGDGCEEANFGLCTYPPTTDTRPGRKNTGLSGWHWSSFCKTQYASDPRCGGVQNFLKCHLVVIALLEKAKELGCLEKVDDEGGFWEKRDLKALVEQVGSWNQMIAALGGRLKDVLGDGLRSAIAGFPNFEHLEAAGQSQLPPDMERFVRLIKQIVAEGE